jgi:hypothetical protein
MANFCLFCSKPMKDRSREHIIPQWLWPYLGMTKLSMIGSVHKGRTGPSTSYAFVEKELPTKALGKFLEGRVCRECNPGWMSLLEEAVKPLLIPILDTPTLVDEWSVEDRKVLARWAVKTSLMALSRSVVPKNVPKDHFTAIKQGIIPEGVSVFAGYHMMVEKRFGYDAGRRWDVEIPPETPEELKTEILQTVNEQTYKVCFQFRSLLLMTAFSPMQQLALSFDSRTHQLILEGGAVRERSNPPMFTPRKPLALMLPTDKARRHFVDSLRLIWL